MLAHLLPGARRILVLDVLAIVWAVLWLVIGLRVAEEVGGLRELSATAASAGRAVQQVGATLDAIDLPLIGGQIDQAARAVRDAGAQTVDSARAARESVGNLQFLLGLSIALIPVSPLLLVYVPLRIAHVRERRALRALLVRARSDPELERLLARRTLESMSNRRLRRLTGRPWADVEAGELRRVTDAEAERVGLRLR